MKPEKPKKPKTILIRDTGGGCLVGVALAIVMIVNLIAFLSKISI